MKLAVYDAASASKLTSKSTPSELQIFKTEGVVARVVPMPKDPIIEFKTNLEATIKKEDILLDDGYSVQTVSADSAEAEGIIARFTHSNPIMKLEII